MKYFLLILLILNEMSCSVGRDEAVPRVLPEFLISPGIGIGEYLLDQSVVTEEATAWALENGLEIAWGHSYSSPGENGWFIFEISTTSTDFATAEGLQVGDSIEEVQAVLGELPSRVVEDIDTGQEFWSYSHQGTLFLVQEGVVFKISVGYGE